MLFSIVALWSEHTLVRIHHHRHRHMDKDGPLKESNRVKGHVFIESKRCLVPGEEKPLVIQIAG